MLWSRSCLTSLIPTSPPAVLPIPVHQVVYGLNTQSQAPKDYADFLHHVGATTDLQQDNSKVKLGFNLEALNWQDNLIRRSIYWTPSPTAKSCIMWTTLKVLDHVHCNINPDDVHIKGQNALEKRRIAWSAFPLFTFKTLSTLLPMLSNGICDLSSNILSGHRSTNMATILPPCCWHSWPQRPKERTNLEIWHQSTHLHRPCHDADWRNNNSIWCKASDKEF